MAEIIKKNHILLLALIFAVALCSFPIYAAALDDEHIGLDSNENVVVGDESSQNIFGQDNDRYATSNSLDVEPESQKTLSEKKSGIEDSVTVNKGTSDSGHSSVPKEGEDKVNLANSGLVYTSEGTRYLNDDGSYVVNSWKTVGKDAYYFDSYGYAVCYEQYINNKHYYFSGSGVMQKGWVTWKADKTKTYFGLDGVALTGWQTIGDKRYYFDSDNKDRSARWEAVIDGERYYFDSDSSMVTGLVTWKTDGTKSFFDPEQSGKAISGWKTIDGETYYFDQKTGRSFVYEKYIDGKHYYFSGSGVMQKGWVTWKADKTKTYFGLDGVALTGWQTIGDKRYYFDSDNKDRSARWEAVIDGERYYFDSDSSMVTGLVTWKTDGTKSFFDPEQSGKAISGWKTIDGETYYFDGNNNHRSLKWAQTIDGKDYYFDSNCVRYSGILTWKADGTRSFFDKNGVMVSGWQTDDGKWYYIDEKTMRAVRYLQTIDGKDYYFDSNCVRYSGILTWKADGTKSFFNSDGVMSSGWQTWKGDKYYINPKTMRAVKYLQTISGNKYYFDSECKMHTGWLKWNADGKYSYFKPNGMMVFGTYTVDGVKYNFGTSGKVNSIDPIRSDMVSKAQKYSSGTKYLILVDLSAHKVGVFKGKKNNWSLQYYWSCVTGAPSTPTIKGKYKTTGFTRSSLSTDSRAIYCTQIWGGYFFHSILASESELGKSLSHGCIRLPYSAANWIYKNINAGTTVYIYK